VAGHRKIKTSAVAEHYLTIIYTTQRDGHEVRSHRLAARLKVSPPTVTETLRRLAKDGYVRSAGRHIQLTERGKAVAEGALRRHFIVERWLTDALGMGWAEADVEAHRLDHGLSDRVAERLFKALGEPKTCPHGNPMPGVAAPRPGRRSLRHVKPRDVVAMERITEEGEEDSDLLDLLESGGIRPGTRLTVEAVSVGTVRVRAGRRALAIGLGAADYIRVKALSAR
jgi:DtxR family Mn-dependent transcriptional regulator